MACVNQTWPRCVNQMGKTQSKSLAAWHGRGMTSNVCISLVHTVLVKVHKDYGQDVLLIK
jgi:hypothetical protein